MSKIKFKNLACPDCRAPVHEQDIHENEAVCHACGNKFVIEIESEDIESLEKAVESLKKQFKASAKKEKNGFESTVCFVLEQFISKNLVPINLEKFIDHTKAKRN